jgi:thymidylate synthase
MIYTRPSMWDDYNHNGMSDFMCTNAVQYMIRDERLIVVVQMRSNDVVFGYRNDYAWQNYVAWQLCDDLQLVREPKIIWNVGNLHVYERHFDMVK